MTERFDILISRDPPEGDALRGVIAVNHRVIGTTLENTKLKIPAGHYKCVLRYTSGHHFVQGPHGVMATQGDFLLEVTGVPYRTNILFHSGNLPRHRDASYLGQ